MSSIPACRADRPRTPNVLLPGIAALSLLSGSCFSSAVSAEEAEAVAIATVVRKELGSEETFIGNVRPYRQTTVDSSVDGLIVEFLVREGDHVTRDQPIARMRTETLEIQLAGAQADLEVRKQELAELKNGTRLEELARTQAAMLATKARRDYFEEQAKRDKLLHDRNALSDKEFRDSISLSEHAVQTYLEAKASSDLATAGARPEQIAQAQGRVAVQEQVVRHLRDQISLHTIKPPFDGYVIAQNAEVGQWIDRGEPLVEIVDIAQVEVVARVSESRIGSVHEEMTARVQVRAVPGLSATGRVTRIVPLADMQARSFPVKILLRNEMQHGLPLFRPGMFAQVALPLGKRQPAILVPKDALVLGEETPFLVKVVAGSRGSGESRVRRVPVRLGLAFDDLIAVTGAIEQGDRVVVEGNERLTDNQLVRVVRTVTVPATAANEPAESATD